MAHVYPSVPEARKPEACKAFLTVNFVVLATRAFASKWSVELPTRPTTSIIFAAVLGVTGNGIAEDWPVDLTERRAPRATAV